MAQAAQWLPFFLFIFLFIVAILLEIRWLSKAGWTTPGRSTAFVLVTDLVGFATGFVIVLAVMLVLFMLVMGPAGRGSDAGNASYAVTMIVGIIFPPVILVLLKRLMLLIMKMRTGAAAWIYAIVSSLVIASAVLIPPPLLFLLFAYIWK